MIMKNIIMMVFVSTLLFSNCASKQLISDKSTVDGAIKNLKELNRWFYYDNQHNDISDKTLREYDNLVNLAIMQLEDLKSKK